MAVSVRNRTPSPFANVLVEVVATIPLDARVTSTNPAIGTFEWKKHVQHEENVVGHGTWSIPQLAASKFHRVTFDIVLNSAKVGDTVTIDAHVVGSEPAALVVEQTKTVTVVD